MLSRNCIADIFGEPPHVGLSLATAKRDLSAFRPRHLGDVILHVSNRGRRAAARGAGGLVFKTARVVHIEVGRVARLGRRLVTERKRCRPP